MDELKPCPKCGSIKVKVDYRWDSLNLAKTYFVYCHCCNICFNGNYSEPSTIAKWNSRPAEDALNKEVERLKKALKKIEDLTFMPRNKDKVLDRTWYITRAALATDTNVLTKESEGEDE